MTQALLEARQLAVEIGGKTVVNQVNLRVASGERIAILGRNGAGKSTLLSTLAGLRPPAAGAVLPDGAPFVYYYFLIFLSSIIPDYPTI